MTMGIPPWLSQWESWHAKGVTERAISAPSGGTSPKVRGRSRTPEIPIKTQKNKSFHCFYPPGNAWGGSSGKENPG